MKLTRSTMAWAISALCGLTPLLSHADDWHLTNMSIGDTLGSETRYFYVRKGENWQTAQFHADYDSANGATLAVQLDGKPAYNQILKREGSVDFTLKNLKSGFHRLDFYIQQQTLNMNPDRHLDRCAEELNGVTMLNAAVIQYQAHRPDGYQIRNLPDALFNPQLPDDSAYLGQLIFDHASDAQATAVAKLTSTWSANTGLHWADGPVEGDRRADFSIEVRHDATLGQRANISLADAKDPAAKSSHPNLLIEYGDESALQNAINALINPDYLAQIHSDTLSVTSPVRTPAWGQPVDIKTLADLGVNDFRLDNASRSVPLNFPGAWQPTGPLQGNIALRAQNGLMQGSQLSIWLNDTLAGSVRLDQLTEDPNEHNINYLSAIIRSTTYYDMRFESTLISNGDCLPRAKGTLWVDTHHSGVNLPHRLKIGVAALSPALIPHPTIATDRNPGSLGMAITLLQLTSKMLLGGQPLPALIQSQGQPTAYIQINAAAYNKIVQAHADKIYDQYANGGTIIVAGKDHFDVVTQNNDGATNFMYRWPHVQSQIPDGALAVLISQDGEVVVLDQYISTAPAVPKVHESSALILIIPVTLGMLALALWWYMRTRRNDSRKDKQQK